MYSAVRIVFSLSKLLSPSFSLRTCRLVWVCFQNSRATPRAEEHLQRDSKSITCNDGAHRNVEYERELVDAVNILELQERAEVIVTATMICIYAHPTFLAFKFVRRIACAFHGQAALGRYPWATAAFASNLLNGVLRRVAQEQLDRRATLQVALNAAVADSNYWYLNLYSPMESANRVTRSMENPTDDQAQKRRPRGIPPRRIQRHRSFQGLLGKS